MAKRLETGQYVRNVASCKNLPPCTTIERDERGHNYIVPDMESLQCEIDEGLIPAGTDWPENYRGLFAYISDLCIIKPMRRPTTYSSYESVVRIHIRPAQVAGFSRPRFSVARLMIHSVQKLVENSSVIVNLNY